MRKKNGVIIIATIAVIAGWNISKLKNDIKLSDIIINNIEALAHEESNPARHYSLRYHPGGYLYCTGPGSDC